MPILTIVLVLIVVGIMLGLVNKLGPKVYLDGVILTI